MEKICQKCKGPMIKHHKINEQTTNIEYTYYVCRCGWKFKENDEAFGTFDSLDN